MTDINLDAFTEDQKAVLIDLIDTKAGEKAKELLDEAKVNSDDLNLSKDELVWKKDSKRLQRIDGIWRNDGYIPGTKERVSLKKLLEKDAEITLKMRDNFSTDHPLLIPRVISNIAREAIEPALVLTPLMSRISFTAGTRVVFPAWGAIHAADIPEGGEYPERSMELAGQVEAIIGKSGVAIKVSEEMMRYSQFDVLSMHIRAAGKALARLKEKKVADLITADYGNIIFDNNSASYKSTTGRDALGAYNGTLTLDDIFYAFATMTARGFTPNTLIMHPFAWQIFAQDGIARAFGFMNGMNPLMWQMPQGQPGNANPWRMGQLNQSTYVSSPENIATTFTNVPSIFPTNFRIVVSPYMSYTSATQLTDIVLCDSAELGILVVDEEVMTDQWDDPARDLTKIKFRERYGLAVQNEGNGIGLLKNIKIGKSYDFADKINLSLTGLTNELTGDAANYGTTV